MSLFNWLLDPGSRGADLVRRLVSDTIPEEFADRIFSPRTLPQIAEVSPASAPKQRQSPERATISVAIPSFNEGPRLRETICTIASAAADLDRVEFCVADDASSKHLFDATLEEDLAREGIACRLTRSPRRLGVAGARNLAAARASGDILVTTDAHVRFSEDWDVQVDTSVRDDTVFAAQIREDGTFFRTYGCRLAFPQMGTTWIREELAPFAPLPIATSIGTILRRALFERIGGYDEGMPTYGIEEPEFCIRAWLLGYTVEALPDMIVWHEFKPQPKAVEFLQKMRPVLTHNALRFALLYFDDRPLLEVARHFARTAASETASALDSMKKSNVRERRRDFDHRFVRDMYWFARTFETAGNVSLWKDVMGVEG